MLVLDVNVVLAAQRGDHVHHGAVRGWLDGMLRRQEPFAVPAFVWWSFLRLTTSRRVFAVPASLDDALAFADAVRAQPGCLSAGPGPRHDLLLRRLCRTYDVGGDLVPDAVLAAVALEHGGDPGPGLCTLRVRSPPAAGLFRASASPPTGGWCGRMLT